MRDFGQLTVGYFVNLKIITPSVRGVYQCEMTEMKRVETFLSENTHQEGRPVKRVIFRFSRLETR